uniref:SF3 helicase domain-containing protein n=1 Tax=viral metagenome TaxID=1070528 RepID=A0A6C0I2U2_9ZZZZ
MESGGTLMGTFANFIRQHLKPKNDTTVTNADVTNLRIGNSDMAIFGGNYIIPDSEYPEFLGLYYRDIMAKGKPEYLVEKQRTDGSGPILVDIDFRHDYGVTEKVYTAEHVDDLIHAYLEEMKEMYQLDGDTRFPIYVFEKAAVKRVDNGAGDQYTKSGIHIVIGVKADAVTQMILRDKMIKTVREMWSDLPITNDWTDVFDERISNGKNGWQLFGSQKPGCDKYELSRIFDVTYCPDDGEFEYPTIPLETFNVKENLYKMSARYPNNITLFMKSDFLRKYQGSRSGASGAGTMQQNNSLTNHFVTAIGGSSSSNMHIQQDLSKIRNAAELESAVNEFLDNVLPSEYELREMHEVTMLLPEQYYQFRYAGKTTYDKWIRVCWALKSASPRLLITWLAFCAKADHFDYSTIPKLCETWEKHDPRKEGGLTKLSLMFWARTDAKEAYEALKEHSLRHYVDETIFSNFGGRTKAEEDKSGCSDYDLALVLYQMFKDEFVCVSVRDNIWYHYKGHRWRIDDSGTTLRHAISEELRTLYKRKHMEITPTLSEGGDGASGAEGGSSAFEKSIDNSKRNSVHKCSTIINKLGRTNDKKNIMTEAKELFYDPTFLEKLDTNQYLLCFNNGVIDFSTKEFRKGLPEDCISMTTRINYTPISPLQHQGTVDEINRFMYELFPEQELRDYMWDHLASTLIGTSRVQTFNMYIGEGSNGKSVLVSLMEHVLGEYKGELPLNVVLDQRGRVGGLTPELVKLKGKRLAVMQEPRKGDVMNEGMMKELTSGKDPITCRAPYMLEMMKFIPQFKLIVTCNTLLGVKANDHGTWRRIRAVPFKALFTNDPVDNDPAKPYQFRLIPDIDEKFESWREVFAAMLVERAFETEGNVKDCSIVLAKSNTYRDSQNILAGFVREKLHKCASGKIKKQELKLEFSAWFQENHGGKEPNIKELHEYMDKEYSYNGKCWIGVEVKYDEVADDLQNDMHFDE